MDPYLESRWPDVHSTLIALVKEALQPVLPPELRARLQERVLLEDTEGEPHGRWSDVAVVETPRPEPGATQAAAVAATVDPVVVEIDQGPPIERWLQIIDVRSGNRVVTAIEVLSPWNKAPGRGSEDYRTKLGEYAAGRVNLVEIDLLRISRVAMPVRQDDLPPQHRSPYLVAVRRARRPGRWFIYPIGLRQRLPRFPVPLRPHDPDVPLDLQPLIERVYLLGGHDDIDYSKPPAPPLDPEDTAWAATLVRDRR
jgi:hypothetical protein